MTVVEIAGEAVEPVPFGCRPDCAYCRSVDPDAGSWWRTPWWPNSHYIVAGLLSCGSRVDVGAMVPSPDGPRCRKCLAGLAKRKRAAATRAANAERAARRAQEAKRATPVRPKPDRAFVGVDPLVAVLQRYEREVCR